MTSQRDGIVDSVIVIFFQIHKNDQTYKQIVSYKFKSIVSLYNFAEGYDKLIEYSLNPHDGLCVIRCLLDPWSNLNSPDCLVILVT